MSEKIKPTKEAALNKTPERNPANCNQQLGQAACASCVAAPNCPILKLKRAQTEQIPTPDKKSYKDELMSDDNELVIAGFSPNKNNKERQPTKKIIPPEMPKPQPKAKTPEQKPQPKAQARTSVIMMALSALENIARKSAK